MLHPARINLPNLLLYWADSHPPKRRDTIGKWNSTFLGPMGPWEVTCSELTRLAAHQLKKIVSSGAKPVKTPILYSLHCSQLQHSNELELKTLQFCLAFQF